jgi:ribosomal protein S18 acetylase RimI-like enzyme
MSLAIEPMTLTSYDQVMALWQATEGVGLSLADSRQAIGFYLARNPGLSLVARQEGRLVGAVLCGHDGRRGFIHHLAVRPEARRQGIGRRLVQECLAGLRREGIQKCHLFVFRLNEEAIAFWRAIGFTGRDELSMMSIYVD